MANWRSMLKTVSSDMGVQTATLIPVPTVAVGWPPLTTLQKVAVNNAPVISVYDHGPAVDTTRWLPLQLSTVVVPVPGITSTLNTPEISPGAHATVTIAGTPNPQNGDAVSLVVNGIGAVYVTQTNDTANTVAAGLAGVINANLSAYLTTSVSGAVVTLNNISTVVEQFTSNVGAGANIQLEVRRAKRKVGIIIWAQTADQRDQISDVIESRLAYLQAFFGYTFTDGTFGRVTFESDLNREDNILQDTYRRDFRIGIDYGVTYADQVYQVLVSQLAFTGS